MNLKIYTSRNDKVKNKHILEQVKPREKTLIILKDIHRDKIEKAILRQGLFANVIGESQLKYFLKEKLEKQDLKLVDDISLSFIVKEVLKKDFYKKYLEDKDSILEIYKTFNQESLDYKDLEPILKDFPLKNNFIELEDLLGLFREIDLMVKEEGLLTYKNFYTELLKAIRETELFDYDKLVVGSLLLYTKQTIDILLSLAEKVNRSDFYFSKISQKAHSYGVFRNSMDAITYLEKIIPKSSLVSVERVSLGEGAEENAIDTFQKFFLSKESRSKDFKEIIPVKSDNPREESSFVVSKVKELIDNGVAPGDILLLVPGSDYKELLARDLKASQIKTYCGKEEASLKNSLYYRATSAIQALLFEKEEARDLLSLSEAGLITTEASLIREFRLRFGEDLRVAIRNSSIYDAEGEKLIRGALLELSTLRDDLNKNLKSEDTWKTYLEFIYRKFQDLGLEKNIDQHNAFVELIDSAYKNIGNKRVKLKDFFEDFLSFLENVQVAANTKTDKEVFIADISEDFEKSFEYIFALGANEGRFLSVGKKNLIRDELLEIINEKKSSNLKTKELLQEEYLLKFHTLVVSSKILYISWAKFLDEKRESRPTYILKNIINIFKNNKIDASHLHKSKELMLEELTEQLVGLKAGRNMSLEAMDYYYLLTEDPFYTKRLNTIIGRIEKDSRTIHSKDIKNIFSKDEDYSVSRLESFNKCPFQHFVRYGLTPNYRKEFTEDESSKGIYYHNFLSSLFEKLSQEEIENLSYSDYLKTARPLAEEIIEDHNERVILSKKDLLIEKERMVSRAVLAGWGNIENLRGGNFKVYATERNVVEVIEKDGQKLKIRGIIDRLDVFKDGDKEYIRVIDYKTSDTNLSDYQFDLGLQIQLQLYASIMKEKGFIPAGYYYSRIALPLDDEEKVDYKKYQLRGPTLNEESLIIATDKKMKDPGYKSNIAQLEKTKKGEMSKRSKLLTQEEADEVFDKVKDIVFETADKIVEGEVFAEPKKIQGSSPCDYCSYRSICFRD